MTAPFRSVIPDPLLERQTTVFTAVLRDDLGQVARDIDLTTLRLTLYAEDPDQPVINNSNKQNILNVGKGTVDGPGNLAITLAPADMVLVDPTASFETHIAVDEWTHSSGVSISAFPSATRDHPLPC